MRTETGDQSGLYELTFREDSGKIRKVVFEACNPAEAYEIFHSLPEIRFCDCTVLEIKKIPNSVYWVGE